MDAGADFIITQMFFDVETFQAFVKHLRRIGVTKPVLPGIMFASNYGGFCRMTTMCKSRVPASMWAALNAIKDDPAAVAEYGIKAATELCKGLMASGVLGLHFYTLNKTGPTYGVLKNLGRFKAAAKAPSALQTNIQAAANACGVKMDPASLAFTCGLLSSGDTVDDSAMTKGTIFS